jgi:glycosyltransferase involved in cell wall biosynthesis
MKILFLTKYGKLGASSRYRTYQYLTFLEKEEIYCNTSSLFTDEYLAARYRKGTPPIIPVLIGFLKRLRLGFQFNKYDLVVIEKELFPYMPVFLERRLLEKARAYTLDFDDALFHIYDQHRRHIVRRMLGDKYAQLISGASLITTGNSYIAGYAGQFAKRVEILPTVIDITKYPVISEPNGIFTIGWIGTPNTQKYLQLIAAPLRRFFEQRKGRFLAIGANAALTLEGVPLEIVPWTENDETRLLQSIHVGIMPLPNMPLERGKSGLKLLQYMACSRPVIASPVGVNVGLVTSEVGYLADTDDEWLSSLLTLADDPALRDKMGEKGRHLAEEKYSLSQWAPRYARMLREAANLNKATKE